MKDKNQLQSNKIKFYLDEIQMSQSELADLVGAEKSVISKLVSGKRKNISLLLGVKISNVLGKTIEEVFNFKAS